MKRFLCMLLAMLCLLGAASAETPEKLIDRAFRQYSTMGGCVAVIQNGEVTFTHCYGTIRNGGQPVAEDTLFQVGSISKMISNIALMMLLDEHGYTLESEIGDVLGYPVRHPEYPDVPVTLRMLMSHTAGLRDSGDYQEALAGNLRPLKELFGKRSEYTWLSGHEPGTKRRYSNLGGGLIGSLIEKLSGQTLDDYMTQHVFAPLGIEAAYQPARFDTPDRLVNLYNMPDRYAAKELHRDKKLALQPDPETHYTYTAGKLIISAPDLCRLLILLCDGGIYENTRLLKESTVAQMTAPQENADGHGLFMNIIRDDQVEGRTMYGHGGKANGMLCAAYFDPTDRTGVVMLTNGCNNEPMHNGVGMLGRVVMRICYDEIIGEEHKTEDPFSVE